MTDNLLTPFVYYVHVLSSIIFVRKTKFIAKYLSDLYHVYSKVILVNFFLFFLYRFLISDDTEQYRGNSEKKKKKKKKKKEKKKKLKKF